MKHLDNIHTDRFYTDLVDNAFLIHEVVEGETQSGEVQTYYDFEDAEDEASYDGAELSEYGNAYYFTNDKIYECVIHLENMECTGINLYDDFNEIKSFVQELLSLVQDDEDELLDQNPWAKKYLVKENNNSMEQKNLKFEGNFGTINLTVETDGYAMGQYQDGGMLEGDFIDGEFKGEWRNKGMEGLVQFTVLDGQLNGSWKKGLDKGPMRGKWEGTLIDEAKDTTEKKSTDKWNIIHDIFSFYTFFANLANEGSQEVENNFVQSEIKKWQFEINSVKYGMDNGNPQNFISLADSVFNALYMLGDSPNKDPFIQLNESHSNLAGYFNKGILNCSMISTLWSSMIKLCQLRGVTEWQDQQLRWYLEQWSSVCPDLSKLTAILDLGVVKNDMAEAIGLEFDDKYHEAKEIILSEGAALPEILCDVLLIGKNRAERIFDQFERDGIVSPKDENGKRKIIQSGAYEESSDDEQIEESTNKKASTEQKELRKNYKLFPVNWGVENVIVIPIRHCMIADGIVNQMEKNAMAHFFENFGKIGEDAELEWDITDDQIMQLHSEGKYGELLTDSATYLKENLNEDQLSKLMWYMATIVSEDDVIQYSEFHTLKFYFDKWFPDALDTYIEKFRKAGMTIITKPNK